jgi:hypothetical protein
MNIDEILSKLFLISYREQYIITEYVDQCLKKDKTFFDDLDSINKEDLEFLTTIEKLHYEEGFEENGEFFEESREEYFVNEYGDEVDLTDYELSLRNIIDTYMDNLLSFETMYYDISELLEEEQKHKPYEIGVAKNGDIVVYKDDRIITNLNKVDILNIEDTYNSIFYDNYK